MVFRLNIIIGFNSIPVCEAAEHNSELSLFMTLNCYQ